MLPALENRAVFCSVCRKSCTDCTRNLENLSEGDEGFHIGSRFACAPSGFPPGLDLARKPRGAYHGNVNQDGRARSQKGVIATPTRRSRTRALATGRLSHLRGASSPLTRRTG